MDRFSGRQTGLEASRTIKARMLDKFKVGALSILMLMLISKIADATGVFGPPHDPNGQDRGRGVQAFGGREVIAPGLGWRSPVVCHGVYRQWGRGASCAVR